MPELPEVETVRRTLAPAIGARITSAWTSGMGLHMGKRPPRARLRGLVGARITGVRRHGKFLIVETDGDWVIVAHLGMTGRLRLCAADEPRAKHTHVVLGLGARDLRFVDARRFGQVDVVAREPLGAHAGLAALGPDALESPRSGPALVEAAQGKRTPLKAFVLDQRVLAGMGNIYASEALWRAQLPPQMPAERLSRPAATRLAKAIREVLRRALDHGGTTLADFVAADGTEGNNADYLWVYGREGEPCRVCGTPIRVRRLGGRASFYCPACQR